jgi:hypothetical protein
MNINIKLSAYIVIAFVNRNSKFIANCTKYIPQLARLLVKCRTEIKVVFLYLNLCLSVMLDSVSCAYKVKKDMDVNEHEKLSNFTPRHTFK